MPDSERGVNFYVDLAGVFGFVFFGFIPLSSIALLFLSDQNERRKRLMSALLVLNSVIFLLPLIYSVFENFPNGDPFNMTQGKNAVYWLYLIIAPACLLVHLLLLILKVVFSSR